MDLLVAYADDPAGANMAGSLARDMEEAGPPGGAGAAGREFRGKHFDLLVIRTPVISADWLEGRYGGRYDSFVFLSKHAAESGVPALTCHSTGNFLPEARFGGSGRQVAVPHPALQKRYMQRLHAERDRFPGFEITVEATHHGPTALGRPCIFVEVGTTPRQWNDGGLCAAVAGIAADAVRGPRGRVPFAVCFGGTHYPEKLTRELLHGELGLGTVVPKRALGCLDRELFDHIIQRNTGASSILLDWGGLGQHKRRVADLAGRTDLEVRRI